MTDTRDRTRSAWFSILLVALVAACGHAPGTVDATPDPARFEHRIRIASPSPFVGEHLGAPATMSGDGSTIAVTDYGSGGPTGGVYVFVRKGEAWTEQAYLLPLEVHAGDMFGASLQLSNLGDTLVAGAPGDSSNATGIDGNAADESEPAAGAAYVFKRHGTLWTEQTYLKASNTDMSDQFGAAAAISGDGNTIAVGAPNEASHATGIDGDGNDNSAFGAGAVYMFTTDGTTWAQQAYIKASNTDEHDGLGSALALSADGSTLVATAPSEASATSADPSDNSLADAGAAYVLARSAGRWSQIAYVKTSAPSAADRFGAAVAISGLGTTLAVAATGEAVTGVVHVLQLAGTWTATTHVEPPPPATSDLFGFHVALSADGDTLAVQAATESSVVAQSGAVFVFATSGGATWEPAAVLKSPMPVLDQRFGNGLALSSNGALLLTGDVGDDTDATDAGAAYVFY